ncbi:hypothetical protein BCR34DRAFT_632815 [Clohesyomyces aquaticus]|uniref:N-acetyltransferase domain-containing protein n=1 Tax=Clohesyomyces aquaticus TaxID=1231657 RepID=A0A1Y1Z7N6_9PLEO|nr:hypothetical protein BCR34DRAFT_632815 [Clohesyomyces aquaticus]
MCPPSTKDLRVEPIVNPADLAQAFRCTSEAFGRQTNDAVWTVTNPGWDTPAGQTSGTARLLKRWESITTNQDGKPNTVFLKATLPTSTGGATHRTVVGLAIWQQCSFIPGYGDPPSDDIGSDLDALDPADRRFASQMCCSLFKRRIEYVKEKAIADPPATFVLDICAVDPAFQRRGIAGKLVQWGLDEAKRRGDLEATTEASGMGRGVYEKLGFRGEGTGDIVYVVNEEFREREKPPNVFLRTGISRLLIPHNRMHHNTIHDAHIPDYKSRRDYADRKDRYIHRHCTRQRKPSLVNRINPVRDGLTATLDSTDNGAQTDNFTAILVDRADQPVKVIVHEAEANEHEDVDAYCLAETFLDPVECGLDGSGFESLADHHRVQVQGRLESVDEDECGDGSSVDDWSLPVEEESQSEIRDEGGEGLRTDCEV